MFRSRFTKTAVSMLAAAVVMTALVGCSDDDNGENNNGDGQGDPAVIGSHGHRLVGDWTPNYASDNNNSLQFISLNSSGEFYWTHFQKVDNFWIETRGCDNRRDGCTWSADDKYFYNSVDGEEGAEYRISGNTMTIFGCDYDEEDEEEDCWEEVWTRGGSRPSGTIHIADWTLNGYWRMDGESLELYGSYMYSSARTRYFEDYHYDHFWYTSGNSLFMLGVERISSSCRYGDDCLYTVAETVEFTYTHSPGATLRLRNTQLDIDDTWEYDDSYDKRQSPFRRFQPRRALSKR